MSKEPLTSNRVALRIKEAIKACESSSLEEDALAEIERLTAERDEFQERFEEMRDVVYNTANVERDLLRRIGLRILDTARDSVAAANHVTVHRQLIGELRAALDGATVETEGKQDV